MLRRALLTLVATSCLCTWVSAADQTPSRMLFITQSVGFKHGSVTRKEGQLAPAEIAIKTLGETSKLFTVDLTQDSKADVTKENLQKYDIVAFYTTGTLPIADADRDYLFKEWAHQKGRGLMGFHSAGDTYHDYEPYWDQMGGTFISHPWGSGNTVTFTVHEQNPLTKPFGTEFTIKDEIYMYRHWQPAKCRVLLSLDYSKSPTGAEVPTEHGYHVPLCWIKNIGEGKLYYNNLGHNESSWVNPAYLESITQAVHWIRGDIEVDAKPNPEVSKAMEEKAQKDFVSGGFKGRGNK
ncbi:MAG: ThuA domain-containing protein [Planctomycetota bacterium]|nr:MAG: ThuA domain-containing protein [Planctomycetota bacterium]